MAGNLGSWTLSSLASLVGNGSQDGWLRLDSAGRLRTGRCCELPRSGNA